MKRDSPSDDGSSIDNEIDVVGVVIDLILVCDKKGIEG
jgi:hypothetical protein